jgi:ubiquinone/menaquinone biosynthesis C-methylase UbiE
VAHSFDYMGIDYSIPFLAQANFYVPRVSLAAGDASRLPIRDNCCDISFSSATIMHVTDYERVITETLRVTSSHAIFHRTPVFSAATTYLRKRAYGTLVPEIVFNEDEFVELLSRVGTVTSSEDVETYSVSDSLPPVTLKTYVCRKDKELVISGSRGRRP